MAFNGNENIILTIYMLGLRIASPHSYSVKWYIFVLQKMLMHFKYQFPGGIS